MTRENPDHTIAYFQQAIKILPGSIYFKNLDGVYLGCNDFQARMAGFNDPRDVIGKSDYDLPWKDYADTIRSTDQRIMKSKTPEELIEYGALPDGSDVIMLTNKSPLYDHSGKVIGIVGTSIDITQRRKAEEREQKALQAVAIAEEKQQSLQMQAGAIAHEMRTPLAALSGVGLFLKKIIPSLVKDHNKLTPDLQEEHFSEKRLSQIMKSPEMIIKVTRQAFSFIDVMLMNLREEFKDEHREQCSIKACVEDALKQYPFSGEDRSMVHTQIEADFLFMGNPLLIKHIFFNLLKNCLYYVKAANKGDITIKTAKVDERHILSFKDTGAGIAPDILPYIFDKFYSRTKYGTGIGLAFCKSVMKSLGGDIICKSQLGEYTEFILTFPTLEKA
jgi:PAS domain S-box-containing protein